MQKFVTDAPPIPPDPPPVRRPRSEGIRERRRKKRLEEIHRAKYVAKETASCNCNCSEHRVRPAKQRRRRRRRQAENSDETKETDALLGTKNERNGQKISDGDIEKVGDMITDE